MAECDENALNPAAPVVVATRCCTMCKETKPITEYYFKDSTHTFRKERCKKCHIQLVKINSLAHPGRKYKSKKPYKKNPESSAKSYLKHIDKRRASGLSYYYKNKERQCALKRQRYAENREARIEKTKKWRAENPEKVKAWVNANRPRLRAATKKHVKLHPETHFISRSNRRARKTGNQERLSMGIRNSLMVWQKGLCPYCKADLNIVPKHLDHLIPLAKGGRHCDANMQLTCKPCNLKKHAKDPILFGREMGIFIPSTELAI